MILQIQARWNELEKKRYKVISEEFHISQLTAKKYVQMSKGEIQALDHPTKYKKRKTLTDDYINMIYKMEKDGIKPEIIFSYMIRKGYTGTWRSLGSRIERLFKNNFGELLHMNFYLDYDYPPEITILSRNELVRYICMKDEKKDSKLDEIITVMKETYPILDETEKVYKAFHTALMGDDANKLDDFIKNYKESSLSSFVEGIEKDIAPIKNAISYPYSSGFVEGNNNKFKLIKRILYGRSGFVNLFRKCYLPFLMNNQDFKLIDLIKAENSTISCAALLP